MNDWQQLSPDKLLDPVTLRRNLVIASLYLLGYELLKSSIVEQLRSQYVPPNWTSPAREAAEKRYQEAVRARHKYVLEASCRWLVEAGAMSEGDIAFVRGATDHRNAVAHELARFLSCEELEVRVTDLPRMQELIRRLDAWWIEGAELPAVYGGEVRAEAEERQVSSGAALIYDYILKVVSELEAGSASRQ